MHLRIDRKCRQVFSHIENLDKNTTHTQHCKGIIYFYYAKSANLRKNLTYQRSYFLIFIPMRTYC